MRFILLLLMVFLYGGLTEAAPWNPRPLTNHRTRPVKELPWYDPGTELNMREGGYIFTEKKLADRWEEVRRNGGVGTPSSALGIPRKKYKEGKEGELITVYESTPRVICFKKGKRKLYVAHRDLYPPGDWELELKARARQKAKEQQEQELLDRLNTVLEGEPAKLGKARVCRTALGTLTQSQWLEYKRIAAVSGEAANAWVKERGYLPALLPGDEVVVLEIDQKLGAAKVATLTGQVVWMTYSCLMAEE